MTKITSHSVADTIFRTGDTNFAATLPTSAAKPIYSGTGTNSAESLSSTFINFLVAEFRIAGLRAKIAANEIETTATALSGGLISVEAAILHLHTIGLPLAETSS